MHDSGFCLGSCDDFIVDMLIVVKKESSCGNYFREKFLLPAIADVVKREGVGAHLKLEGSDSDSSCVLLVFWEQTKVISPWCSEKWSLFTDSSCWVALPPWLNKAT